MFQEEKGHEIHFGFPFQWLRHLSPLPRSILVKNTTLHLVCKVAKVEVLQIERRAGAQFIYYIYTRIYVSSSNQNAGYSLLGVLVESLKIRPTSFKTTYLRSFVEWPAEVVSEKLPPWSFLQHLEHNPWNRQPTVHVCEFLDDLGVLGEAIFEMLKGYVVVLF